MANEFDSGSPIAVLHPNGDVHDVPVPDDASLGDFHAALANDGYAHDLTPMLPTSQPTKEGAIEYSPEFKKLAANMWDKSGRGVQQTEVGTYIDKSGNAGSPTEHSTDSSDHNANIKMNVPNDALAVIHTHPNHSGDRPSQADVGAAVASKKTIYVTSRTGLWAVDPGGKTTQVFSSPLWMRDKNPK
jgi:hypothetical protein